MFYIYKWFTVRYNLITGNYLSIINYKTSVISKCIFLTCVNKDFILEITNLVHIIKGKIKLFRLKLVK